MSAPGVVRRRLVSVPRTFITLTIVIVLLPVLLLGSGLYDLVTRRFDFPTVRLGLFGAIYLLHEAVGIVGAVTLWLTGAFGAEPDQERLRRRQAWLIRSLLSWGRRIVGFNLDIPDPRTLPTGDTIVLSRHASMIDALLPGHVFAGMLDRPVHYVIKSELLKSPIFDIYGTSLENHFVARGDNTDREVHAIEQLAHNARPNSALVIFPEGTYANAHSRQRIAASLRRRGELAALALAEELTTLLPPKPAGSLALLRGRPDASVVIIGHVGLEGVAEFSGLRSHLPARKPIVVRWWSHSIAELPSDDEGRIDWLQEQWRKLDAWVADQMQDRSAR